MSKSLTSRQWYNSADRRRRKVTTKNTSKNIGAQDGSKAKKAFIVGPAYSTCPEGIPFADRAQAILFAKVQNRIVSGEEDWPFSVSEVALS